MDIIVISSDSSCSSPPIHESYDNHSENVTTHLENAVSKNTFWSLSSDTDEEIPESTKETISGKHLMPGICRKKSTNSEGSGVEHDSSCSSPPIHESYDNHSENVTTHLENAVSKNTFWSMSSDTDEEIPESTKETISGEHLMPGICRKKSANSEGSDVEQYGCMQEGYIAPARNVLKQPVEISKEDIPEKSPNKCRKPVKRKLKDEVRERQKREREEKRMEKARDKALKKAASEVQKANRSGLKHIQVKLDQKLWANNFSDDILSALQTSQIQHNFQDQIIENSITWIKQNFDYFCDDNNEIVIKQTEKEECFLAVLLIADEFLELIKAKALRNHIQTIAKQHVKKRIMLIIYNIEERLRFQSINKGREFKAQHEPERYKNSMFDKHIDRNAIEEALIEIQLFENCSHRFVETPPELAALVVQMTKALAEKDFRLEKYENEREKIGWFASGVKRNTVKVDKNGNGLFRLWKQQLCQFKAVNLDTAEAITSVYPSPKSLIQAYENCISEKEGQKLLQNIPVRRGAGPLSTVRRIGPVLSKKIYNFFMSTDGQLSLTSV